MTNLWTDVKTGPKPPEVVYGIIETPQGSKNKFEFDKEIMAIYLDRVLYSSVVFPISYGFIPRTLGDDKDPLDIMVLITEPTFPGCVVSARPIGVLRMKDERGNDDKIIAVAKNDPRLDEAQDLDWIPKHQLIKLRNFSEIIKNWKKVRKLRLKDAPNSVQLSSSEDAFESLFQKTLAEINELYMDGTNEYIRECHEGLYDIIDQVEDRLQEVWDLGLLGKATLDDFRTVLQEWHSLWIQTIEIYIEECGL